MMRPTMKPFYSSLWLKMRVATLRSASGTIRAGAGYVILRRAIFEASEPARGQVETTEHLPSETKLTE